MVKNNVRNEDFGLYRDKKDGKTMTTQLFFEDNCN